jgi:integrase
METSKVMAIPAERMKMKRAHIVPLSHQSIAVLQKLHSTTGAGKYLFPSVRTNDRPMSDVTVLAALRSLGYTKKQMTGPGSRAMASSLLSVREWSVDAIELQLAHADNNKTRTAYHRADHIEERRRMMQDWAYYPDLLRKETLSSDKF